MRDTPPSADQIDPNSALSLPADPVEGEELDEAEPDPPDEDAWLATVGTFWDGTEDWLVSGVRAEWNQALKLFASEHPDGSKYRSPEFAGRSRLFRPKTRSAVRRGEAACASAFFSTVDQVSLQPEDEQNPLGRPSAGLWGEVLNFRLRKTIPWFLTVIGAYQDAKKQGVCVSKQYWHYEEHIVGQEPVMTLDPVSGDEIQAMELDPATGVSAPKTQPKIKVLYDRPWCELIPPENFRIDAACDWRRPIETTPGLIYAIPMYVRDVKSKMRMKDPKTGQPAWRKLDDSTILKARDNRNDDSTRKTREGNRRQDPRQQTKALQDHETVWVWECIFRRGADDVHFYSLGRHALLTEVRPLEEVYLHGMRPFAMGIINVETHKAYPTPSVLLTGELQKEINDHINLRLDVGKLSLQPRVKVKAGRNINHSVVSRLVHGEVITVTEQDDVMWDKPPPADAAAFQEEDRMSVEMDEMQGQFSQASVQNNRQLNETVGGMQMMQSSAGSIGEYDMRVFTETWFEPAVTQILKLEQAYETDLTILALASNSAQLGARYGVSKISDDLLEQDLLVQINVGVGATDPMQQLQRFALGFDTIGKILTPVVEVYGPAALQSPGAMAVIEEVFGKIGYKDARRFFDFGSPAQPAGEDPQMKMIAEMNMTKFKVEADERIAKMQEASLDRREQFKAEREHEREMLRVNAEAENGRRESIARVLNERRAIDQQQQGGQRGGEGGGKRVIEVERGENNEPKAVNISSVRRFALERNPGGRIARAVAE